MVAPVKFVTCDVGPHEHCYFIWQEIHDNAVLNLPFKINKVRKRTKLVSKINRKSARFQHKRLQPDIQDIVEVAGCLSQEERNRCDWEETSEEEVEETQGVEEEEPSRETEEDEAKIYSVFRFPIHFYIILESWNLGLI